MMIIIKSNIDNIDIISYKKIKKKNSFYLMSSERVKFHCSVVKIFTIDSICVKSNSLSLNGNPSNISASINSRLHGFIYQVYRKTN